MKKTIATAPGNPSIDEDYSAAETAAREQEEQAWANDTPMREWQEEMDQTDKELPRWAEDMIDAYGTVGLAADTKDKYDLKKTKRALKPDV